MTPKKKVAFTFVLSVLALGLAAPAGGEEKGGKPAYVHAVIVFLKKDAPEGARDALIPNIWSS